jgi:hypothetical protein
MNQYEVSQLTYKMHKKSGAMWLAFITRGIAEETVTPWSRVLLEKLTVTQLAKKFPAFYRTRVFIIVFKRLHHPSLS